MGKALSCSGSGGEMNVVDDSSWENKVAID